jgi:uncharacterized protein YeaO (DUF488 family)
MIQLKLKRVYEKPSRDDGFRILVDRLWPRGLTKERAAVDLWLKDVAPSTELRKWFVHDPAKWREFHIRYRRELAAKKDAVKLLVDKSRENAVTLLYAARDEEHNEAQVLKGMLVEKGDRHLTTIVVRGLFACQFGASPLFQRAASQINAMMAQSSGSTKAVPRDRLSACPGRQPICSALLGSLALAVGIACLSGCDPVRTITHDVTIAVSDAQGLPARDLKVSMKESWESWRTWGSGVSKNDEAHCRQVWAGDFVPWRQGTTNAQGRVIITVEVTAIDSTRGNEPPACRDTVSNREFIIKLQGQNVQDEVRLLMKPGASAKGKSHTVAFIDIEKPHY